MFFNNNGEMHDTCLLDFFSLENKRHTAKNICNIAVYVLNKHNLLDELSTIIMDNASNNGSFHTT